MFMIKINTDHYNSFVLLVMDIMCDKCLPMCGSDTPTEIQNYTAARNRNFPKSFHTQYTYQHLVENRMFIASYWKLFRGS